MEPLEPVLFEDLPLLKILAAAELAEKGCFLLIRILCDLPGMELMVVLLIRDS